MTKGKPLSAEDMRVLKETAEQLVLGDGLPSIKEVEAKLAKALQDSCRVDLGEAERLRLQTIVEVSRIYLDLVSKQVNYRVNCFTIKRAFG
jgi:hypothetical protein